MTTGSGRLAGGRPEAASAPFRAPRRDRAAVDRRPGALLSPLLEACEGELTAGGEGQFPFQYGAGRTPAEHIADAVPVARRLGVCSAYLPALHGDAYRLQALEDVGLFDEHGTHVPVVMKGGRLFKDEGLEPGK